MTFQIATRSHDVLSERVEDFCFLDFETRSRKGVKPPLNNVKTGGTYAYLANAVAVILTYAVGDGPVRRVSMDGVIDESGFRWADMPDELREHHARAASGAAWFVAWNMGFDRTAWNRSTADFPRMEPEMTIDAMAQGGAANLPPALEGASRAIGRGGKQDDGKALIQLFSNGEGPQPCERPGEWRRFCTYAARDTAELREVFQSTRQLPRREWEEYWASEHINERGMVIDMDFARRAAAVAAANVARSNARLAVLTGKSITKVTQIQRIAPWVYDRLDFAEAREMMIKEFVDDPDSEDDEVKEVKLGLSRDRIERLVTFFEALDEREGLTDEEAKVLEVLELRQWDGSSAPAKFAKMLAQADGDLLRGSYVFNGAAQTGRYSSKGVQVHNLTNKFIGLEDKSPSLELEAIETVMEIGNAQ